MIKIPDSLTFESQLLAAKRVIVDMPGGEDLYQAVCIKCMVREPRPDWSQEQLGLIRCIARSTSIDMLRRQKVREGTSVVSVNVDPVCSQKTAGQLLIASERDDIVRRCIYGLAEPYRTTIIARYFDGKSASEIAREQRVPLNTVNTWLKRARRRLASIDELQACVN